jgi:hypothetical protein
MLIILSIIAALFAGCASAQKVKQEAAITQSEQKPVKKQATIQATGKKINKEQKYLVKKGDSLWKISAKSSVYGDPFEWPLLFRANRDQITDPDLIAVNQELGVKKEFDDSLIEDVKQEAKDTPPYKAHSEPRKELPLKY